jgi:predicted metal-dependent hydrolase
MKQTQFKKILRQIFGIRTRIVLRKRKKGKRSEYLKYKEKAREIAEFRCKYFAEIYNLKYNKISIRNQRTRWGSCSRRGNLNFSYKIALLPEELSDYIIVHEVCHLGQFNHSKDFWNLVAKTVPNYIKLKEDLKHAGMKME